MRFGTGFISLLSAIGFGCPSISALAQQTPQQPAAQPQRPAFQMPAPTPNDTLKSVEVQPDRHVRFRIRAPNATDVKLQAEGPESTPGITPEEAYKNMGGVPMVKGEQGIWEVTIGPIEPGIYRYTFIVNGVTTTDPRNPLTSQSLPPPRAASTRFPAPHSWNTKPPCHMAQSPPSTTTPPSRVDNVACIFTRLPATNRCSPPLRPLPAPRRRRFRQLVEYRGPRRRHPR